MVTSNRFTMRDHLYSLPPPRSVAAVVTDTKYHASRVCEEWTSLVRARPKESLMIAAAAGCLVHRLPFCAIFNTAARSVASMLPAALGLAGAYKVVTHLTRKDAEWQSHQYAAPPPVPTPGSDEILAQG